MNNYSIDEVSVGQIESFSVVITSEMVKQFSDFTGDKNPLHVDKEYASFTQFGKPIVHGMLTSSFFSTLVGMYLPGKRALFLSQKLEFLKPVFYGDKIIISGEVEQISRTTGIIVLKTLIKNSENMIVVKGQSIVKII